MRRGLLLHQQHHDRVTELPLCGEQQQVKSISERLMEIVEESLANGADLGRRMSRGFGLIHLDPRIVMQ